jgi:hypothetical protein
MKFHDIMQNGVGIPEDKAEYTVGPWLSFDAESEKHTGAHADAANALLKDPNNSGFEVPAADKV